MAIQARKDGEQITQVELAAVAEWVKQNPEFDTEENGSALADYLLNRWKVVINTQSLAVAKQKLVEANLLTRLSHAEVKIKAVISSYPPDQFDAFNKWFEKQTSLVNRGDEGFENAAALLTELRGRPFSDRGAWDAVGRAQYSGKALYFKPGPEADRSMVGGKVNHAAKPSEPFMPKSEVRSTLDQSYEHNPLRHKADPKSTPEPVLLDSTEARWKEMAQKLLRTGNSHSENDELQNAFNNHLVGSWRKTFEAMSEIKKDRMRRAAMGA